MSSITVLPDEAFYKVVVLDHNGEILMEGIERFATLNAANMHLMTVSENVFQATINPFVEIF